jgi:hypothetical protein
MSLHIMHGYYDEVPTISKSRLAFATSDPLDTFTATVRNWVSSFPVVIVPL